MKNTVIGRWGKALAFSVPVLAVQVATSTALQSVMDVRYVPGVAHAQQQDKPASERETRRTPALSNKVYEKLSEAQTFAEAKQFAEAIAVLDVLKGKQDQLNSYEVANLYQMYGFIYYTQENYDAALKAYEMVIRQPDIPLAMEVNNRFTIAQLYFVQENFQKGVEALLEWFKLSDNPGANAYVLLAQGYYQLKDYDLALANVNKAIDLFKEADKIPKENWYSLQRFLYYEKGDVAKVVEVLRELLQYYPKKQYWLQLSAMYGELKRDKDQLSAMEAAYRQGMLTGEKELINLAYMFLANDVPYKAAKVLDQGVKSGVIEPTAKNLELLGNAWRAAQELAKSIPELAKAAEKSDEGDLYARLGSVYLDNDEFQKAADAIRAALRKGGVRRVDNAQLVLGMALFNLKQYEEARKAFRAAAKDERSKPFAEQWIKFMDKELERQSSLKDGLS